MVDRERPIAEVPKGSPLNLPAKPGERVLDDAGFDCASFNKVEQAGVDIDFDAFQREAVPDDGSLIYVPKLSAPEIRALRMAEANIRDAVADAAITDEAIEKAGRRGVASLHAANIGDQLVQKLLDRAFSVDQRRRLQDCPAASLTAAFLLMGHEALRTVGANIALSVPDGIAIALRRLHDERRLLPGSRAFVQIQQQGRVRDKEALFSAARERSQMFFESMISMIDDIDGRSLLEFAEMAPTGAERFKQMTARRGILTPLKDRERSLRETIIAYAKHIEGGRSHFGTVVEKPDGLYEVVGLRELQAVHDASDRFFENDFLRSFFINLRKVQNLPGISPKSALGMSMQRAYRPGSMAPEDMNTQADFQASIAYEIFVLFRKTERHYAEKLIRLQHGTADRTTVETKRAIARGVIVELLMINEFFMQTIERNTPVLQGLKRGLQTDPETVVTHPNSIVKLNTAALFSLGNASRLYNTHKTALTILEGVFG